MKTFFSKRNEVTLETRNGRRVVVKRFATVARADLEYKNHRIVREAGLLTPELLGRDGATLTYEYIDAPTVCEVLEQAEAGEVPNEVLEHAYKGMFGWLMRFAQVTGLSFGDVNARNFLFDGEAIYAVDFEGVEEGTVEEDLGKALAFLETYEPPGTRLKKSVEGHLMGMLQESSDVDICAVKRAKRIELEAMASRRS